METIDKRLEKPANNLEPANNMKPANNLKPVEAAKADVKKKPAAASNLGLDDDFAAAAEDISNNVNKTLSDDELKEV